MIRCTLARETQVGFLELNQQNSYHYQDIGKVRMNEDLVVEKNRDDDTNDISNDTN